MSQRKIRIALQSNEQMTGFNKLGIKQENKNTLA